MTYQEDLLKDPNFLKVHRSYIVNLNHVKCLEGNGFITICDIEIPIARKLYRRVKEYYINNIFEE